MVTTENDEPLTPAGRLFLRPEMNQIINCAIGLKNPIDVDAFKSEIKVSAMIKQPRFSSLLVHDSKGREHWRRTQVDVDRHVIIRDEPITDDYPSVSGDDAVNDYLADLAVSSPLGTDKPLWEFHLLMAHNCVVLRVHHALGDGISLMSMFLLSCRRADDPTGIPTIGGLGTSSSSSGGDQRSFWKLLKVVWYTWVFVVEFCLRSLWLKDEKTAISGGAGVELWPRKLVTAKFKLDDMKVVKKAVVGGATINDVLFGIISCGLSRYLSLRSPSEALKEGLKMTGLAMVNLRPQPGLQEMSKLLNDKSTRFGNQFGMLLLPVYYHKSGSDPHQYVRRAKKMIDKKKLSLEAIFSYRIGDFVMSNFGPKLACMLNYRILSNTTFTISNVIGPAEEVTVIGNPITYLRVTSTSLPQAITMHMVSYAGRADMQIAVAKDIITDPQLLVKCLEDALFEMKNYALASSGNHHQE